MICFKYCQSHLCGESIQLCARNIPEDFDLLNIVRLNSTPGKSYKKANAIGACSSVEPKLFVFQSREATRQKWTDLERQFAFQE